MKREFERWEIALAGVVVLTGLVLRLRLAVTTYPNPDEAIRVLWAEGSWWNTLRNSALDTHPPLFLLITHAVLPISRAELAVRLVPVLAGSLFPILLFFWLRRMAGEIAAAVVLILMTLAPNFVAVSAQASSYTLAMSLLSASLLILEEAFDRDRWQYMAAYSLLLWLCILSDYSMAWFVGGVGIYCLLRISRSSGAVKAAWAVGQLVAVALYGLLFAVQVSNFRAGATEQDAVSGWLSGSFPKPGGMLTFPFVNTVKPFAYLMASVPVGVLAVTLFAAGLVCLWSGRTGMERGRARPLAVLMVVPFLLNIAGAYARLFPYGRSRHTLVIGLFGACGVAVFVQMLPRRAAIAVLWGALLLTPLWYAKADPQPQNIGADRNKKMLMVECLAYMHSMIPPNTLIFTTRDTLEELAYYESHKGVRHPPVEASFQESSLGPWRVATRNYKYLTRAGYEAGLADFRLQYGLAPDEPVWVLNGGWDPVARPADPNLPFTKAVRVFQAGSR